MPRVVDGLDKEDRDLAILLVKGLSKVFRMVFHLPFQRAPMTLKTKVSSQGRTVIPVEIREKLGIREGEEVEWALESEVMVVRPVREEKTPNEIMEYLRNHLVEIKATRSKVSPTGLEKRMMNEWVRRKLGLTP